MNNNYYNEIKNELLNNEVYKRVKDYSKNRNELSTYYNVGKLLIEAGKQYGEKIIENYYEKLVVEVGKKYNKRTLFRMRQFYKLIEAQKLSPMATQLTWFHYCELLSFKVTVSLGVWAENKLSLPLRLLTVFFSEESNTIESLESKTVSVV